MESKDATEKKTRRTGKTYWHKEATNVLKSLMVRDGVTYKKLSTLLDDKLGLVEDVRSLRNKIARGTFSFIFFMQCLHALGQKEVALKLSAPPPKPKKPADKKSTAK